ncbi:MAG: tRNA lysidine(34) synthetase TilS [Anaerolineales bacterium]
MRRRRALGRADASHLKYPDWRMRPAGVQYARSIVTHHFILEDMKRTITTRVVNRIRDSIERHDLFVPGETVVLGVSGGPDSLCMLHVLRRLADEYALSLHVGHLHHGIRGEDADEDARFVKERCDAWDIPCRVNYVDVPRWAEARGIALEEAARQARYTSLRSLARALDSRCVAVAHNADDQVETILMHILRGSGLSGLRGMLPTIWMDEMRLGNPQPQRPPEKARVRLVRPLLDVPREEIAAYCAAQGLAPRFDRSNLDTTYFRNRLRHELLPHLETYNPNIRRALRRMADVIAADHEVLRQLRDETWPRVVCRESDEAILYDLEEFQKLSLGLRRSLLRQGIHRLRFSLRDIEWGHIDDAITLIDGGEVGSMIDLPRGLCLRLTYSDILLADEDYRLPRRDRPRVREPVPVPLPGRRALPARGWVFETCFIRVWDLPPGWDEEQHPHTAYLDAARVTAPLVLRPRREGDRFVPLGLDHSQKVSDFMINVKIPRRERDTIPLLTCEGKIIWIVGWRLDARYAVTPETKRVLVTKVYEEER